MNGSGTIFMDINIDYSIRFKLNSVIGLKNFQVPLLLCTEINKCMGKLHFVQLWYGASLVCELLGLEVTLHNCLRSTMSKQMLL